MPSVPSSVALTTINDGSQVIAADHRNNYSALQTAVNGLQAVLADVAAKGDLLVATADDVIARLAVGADGLLLVADSAQATGVKWGGVGYGTSLPASPADGREYVLVDSTTAPTYQWRFRYNAGSSSAYKWEFVGGASAFVAVEAIESTTSTTYVDLTTVGPSFTLPRSGDYAYTVGAELLNNTAGAFCYTSVKLGAAATLDDHSAAAGGVASVSYSPARTRRISGAAAADVWKVQYKVTGGTGSFLRRYLSVVPVRVS